MPTPGRRWVIFDRDEASSGSRHVGYASKAEVKQGIGICHEGPGRVDGIAQCVIQAPKPEPQIMRYEISDYEWAANKPFLPNKPRVVPRVNDRRELNGIFWVMRSGAPWRDLPQNFGPTPPATIASCAGDGRASGPA
jgi:Putative transposase of IS4/5 family (DUF4096)